jgi:hypothetical protein
MPGGMRGHIRSLEAGSEELAIALCGAAMPVKRESEASILMWEHLNELRVKQVCSIGREYQFLPPRKWRLDFAAWSSSSPNQAWAIEIEGGAFTQGRHTRGVGFIRDMEKYNHAALLGWRVLRFTPSQVLDGTAIAFIKKALKS